MEAGTGQRSRRRFRSLNLATFLPILAAVGVYLLVRQAQSWRDAVVLGLGLAAALLAFERWSAGDLLRVSVPCLAVAAAVWPYGVLLIDVRPQTAYYAIAIVGCLVVAQLPRHRAAAAVGLAAYVAAVGVLGLVTTVHAEASDLIALVIVPTGITVILTGLMFPNTRFYDVMAELENARALMECAGIDVRVDGRARAGAPAVDLLAQVLRETTTNILRHSQATQVRVALSERSITIVNDGVIDDVLPELGGLAALACRVSDDGGELTVKLEDGRFLTAATFA